MKFSELSRGQQAVVTEVVEGPYSPRLASMGFRKGIQVQMTRNTISGGVFIKVDGNSVVLHKSLLSQILVNKVGEENVL